MPETKAQFDAITKAHTSLWVGLWVPLETAKTIALPTELYQTAEPPEELHLTLVMCGDVAALGEESVAGALEALKVYAKGAAPVEGSISGIGRFTGGESDVLYASYDAPDLPAFRQGLVAALEHVGVPLLTDHGFSPHITLAYVEKDKGANLFPLGTVPDNIPIRFDSLRVGVGGTYYDFALEERELEKTWSKSADIAKVDDERRLVFGYLSVAVDKDGNPVVDLQGDIIPPDELEKAAYDYVLFARGVGEMHQRTEGVGRLVESMVFTKQKQEALGIPAGVLPETAWWIGYKIDDEAVWKKVKSGEYRAFSIGGRAKRKPAEGGSA